MLVANARSVINKREELTSLVDNCNASIIALTETWLHSHVQDCEIFDLSRFRMFRCDRTARQGGGVLLATSKSLQCHHVNIQSDLEVVCACVDVCHRKITIVVCYRPPSYPPTFVAELHDVLNTLTLRHPSNPIILMGDFNFPNICWDTDPPRCNPFSSQCKEFLDLCSLFSLTQLVVEPTRISNNAANILDLIFCSHPDIVANVACIPGLSDHLGLSFNISLPALKPTVEKKLIYRYDKANFDDINAELASFLDPFFNHFDDRTVDENWIMFKNKILELTHKFVPSSEISCNVKKPWFNAQLKRLSNKKSVCIE